MLEKKHIMIDIETLGVKNTAPILSIAAVEFSLQDPIEKPKQFYMNVDIDSCLDFGCRLEMPTIKWWLKRTSEEQLHVTDHDGIPLAIVLLKLQDFIKKFDSKEVRIWGNSARFDLGILSHAYQVCETELPWNHYNELDVRTIVAFNPSIKEDQKFKGARHNPVNDCLHQIAYVTKTLDWVSRSFDINPDLITD